MSRVLFTGGRVIAFDGPPVTSLAIEGDRIVALGDDAEVAGATVEETWLGGSRVFPA